MKNDFYRHNIDFNEHMKVKNYSPMTVNAYSMHLTQFLDWLRKEQEIREAPKVNRDTLNAYQLRLAEYRDEEGRPYTTSTLSLKLRAIKRFFEYLEDTGYILVNPAEHLKEPKKEIRLPRVVLTEAEARKILDAPNLSTMTGIRDRAVLEVFYSTGVRLEELVNLTIYDCDLQGGLLRVNKGKGAKDRVIPLGRHAIRFLKEYIARIRPQFTKTDKTIRSLFVNQLGGPLSKQVVEITVRNYAKKAGIGKKVTPHVFRHTFATQLIKNGADIVAVQKMLGHSDLKVTHIYMKVAGLDVKKTHSGHHPREKDRTNEDPTPRIERVKGKYRRAA